MRFATTTSKGALKLSDIKYEANLTLEYNKQ